MEIKGMRGGRQGLHLVSTSVLAGYCWRDGAQLLAMNRIADAHLLLEIDRK
jgi:hypothetical protein